MRTNLCKDIVAINHANGRACNVPLFKQVLYKVAKITGKGTAGTVAPMSASYRLLMRKHSQRLQPKSDARRQCVSPHHYDGRLVRKLWARLKERLFAFMKWTIEVLKCSALL